VDTAKRVEISVASQKYKREIVSWGVVSHKRSTTSLSSAYLEGGANHHAMPKHV
jgi:hypothetical protein